MIDEILEDVNSISKFILEVLWKLDVEESFWVTSSPRQKNKTKHPNKRPLKAIIQQWLML